MADQFTIELSELDQIMPRLYVRWLLPIPLPPGAPPKESIVDILQSGIASILAQLPILKGHLVPKRFDSSRLEVLVPNTAEGADGLKLNVKHLDSTGDATLPTYAMLKEANFPISELPDRILTPSDNTSLPVFDAQATFIRGGLLLCIKCHHATTDGAGLGMIVKLLAQQCFAQSQTSSPAASPRVPNIDRSVLPVGNPDEKITRNIGFSLTETDSRTASSFDTKPMVSHNYRFSFEVLQNLKMICSPGSVVITSHDALTALLYGAVSYARALRLTSTSTEERILPSTMGIAVNGRSRLKDIAPDYAGNCTLYGTFSSPLHLPCSTIPQKDIRDKGIVASKLRLPFLAAQAHSAVAAVTKDYIISTISLARSLDDVSRMEPKFSNFYQGTDFFITSAANFPIFEEPWWPGGCVDAWRIPLKAQWDGSCAVLATRDRSKGLEVCIGLREDDMKVVNEIVCAFGADLEKNLMQLSINSSI